METFSEIVCGKSKPNLLPDILKALSMMTSYGKLILNHEEVISVIEVIDHEPLQEILKHTREAVLLPNIPCAGLAVKVKLGDWEFIKITSYSKPIEKLSITQYLDLKEQTVNARLGLQEIPLVFQKERLMDQLKSWLLLYERNVEYFKGKVKEQKALASSAYNQAIPFTQVVEETGQQPAAAAGISYAVALATIRSFQQFIDLTNKILNGFQRELASELLKVSYTKARLASLDRDISLPNDIWREIMVKGIQNSNFDHTDICKLESVSKSVRDFIKDSDVWSLLTLRKFGEENGTKAFYKVHFYDEKIKLSYMKLSECLNNIQATQTDLVKYQSIVDAYDAIKYKHWLTYDIRQWNINKTKTCGVSHEGAITMVKVLKSKRDIYRIQKSEYNNLIKEDKGKLAVAVKDYEKEQVLARGRA